MNDEALEKKEKLVEKYIEKNRKAEAVKLLFELITAYAEKKNFTKAESFRDKIFDVDSMALDEIIRAAEIIESEKNEAIDEHHMKIWHSFYTDLTPEESNAFYFTMKKKRFGPGEIIFRQGWKNNRLFFVDTGQLKLIYRQGNRELFIKSIGAGNIGGEDTFFSITVCTASLVTVSSVEINYIDQKDFENWRQSLPTLASKIETYCHKIVRASEYIEKKGINRREHRRIKVSGPILFLVLNAAGKPIGKAFRGELSDISVGGLSFFIKTANPKNALMLLGRTLRIRFKLPVGGGKNETEQRGIITGVINHHFRDYSIHMRLDTPISRLLLDELEAVPESERVKVEKEDRSVV